MSKLEYTREQLEALRRVAMTLAGPGDLDAALKETLKALSRLLGMKRGIVSIYRRDLNEVHMLVARGLGSKRMEPVRYRLGEGITGRVVKSGRPVAVPRLDKEPLFLDRTGVRRDLDRAELAFLCVPIRYGKEVVGALSADRVSDPESNLDGELRLLEEVAGLIASRVVRRRVREENKRLKESAGTGGTPGMILGSSEAMVQVRYLVSQVADSKATILLTGETGTGKGLIARSIHRSSPRADQSFVQVNCGAIPENLVESELFGHERGAFTGATEKREGRFEAAGAGTLFLDEVDELPMATQVKLLRVLQEHQYERVGSNRVKTTRARIIAASNRDLEKAVMDGRFRPDLYYRLNVFPIHVPPLRERGADVTLLADHFIQMYAREFGKDVSRMDTPAIDMFMAYHWPGNVRELENAIERAVLLAKDGVIRAHLLPPSLQMKTMESRAQARGRLEQLVASYEMELIVDALKDAGGNQTRAAELLE
ncbi:MAG: GAF domain-containing protein, partial [Deltaproteobacteria bacterium]|nr:GAF domain-containing protein [Deltaproteobacteria bacterium]